MATATSESGIARTWAGTASANIIDQETGLSRVFRTPSDFEIDLGIKTKTIDGSNSLGEKVEIERYVDENKPQFMLKVGGANTQLLGLQIGREIVNITGSTEKINFRKQALVSPTPPVPVGGFGYEIATDAVASAGARLLNGLSVGLTQQPFTTFNPATLLSFAVGANGVFKYSNDLIQGRYYLNILVTAIVDVQSLSENSIGLIEVRVVLRNSDGSVTTCWVPSVRLNPEGAKISASAAETDIKGSVITTGCQGFYLKDFASRLTC